LKKSGWKIVSEEHIGNFRIFDIKQLKAVSPRTGNQHPYYLLDSTDWVNIIPITKENEVIMVNQFRFGTSRMELEIPGGMVENDEDPMEAAIRELREETGYIGNKPIYLGHVDPNPAFLTNKCHMFLVEECKYEGKQELDPGEDIEVQKINIKKIKDLIKDGTIGHSLVICAFNFLDLHRK